MSDFGDERTAVELFCGAGGMATGFESADFNILYGLDIDENSTETYRANHTDSDGDGTIVECADITEVDPEDIRTQVTNRFGEGAIDDLDMIIGGPPCEGFSMAGLRDPDDPRNELFEHYLKIVDGLQPKAFVMENVQGILTMEDGAVKDEILSRISEAGYNIGDPWLLNAADYGVPQKRKRVFFVGVHEDFSSQEISEPPEDDERVTVWDAISDLPSLGPGDEKKEYDLPWHTEYQRRMRANVEDDELTHHEAANHREPTRMRFRLTPPGGNPWDFPSEYDDYRPDTQYDSRHRKLDPTEPSFTVTSHAIDEMVHYEDPRILSVREVARIQSFPDDYVFEGPRSLGHDDPNESQYEQVGNSVPPLLAGAIADHLQDEIFS